MPASSLVKSLQLIKSMEVNLSEYKYTLYKKDIDNLVLGENRIQITNPEMIIHCMNSDMDTLNSQVSIQVVHKYTKQSDNLIIDNLMIDSSSTYTTIYESNPVCIAAGKGDGFVLPDCAYIYYGNLSAITNAILSNFINNKQPSIDILTINELLSIWFQCITQDAGYVAQQIILYATMYSYIYSVLQGKSNTTVSLNIIATYIRRGGIHDPKPSIVTGTVGSINFKTAWPFDLSSLSVLVDSSGSNVYYSPSNNNLPLPTGLSIIDENVLLNNLNINLPILISSNNVSNYSCSVPNIVSFTPGPTNQALMMNIIGLGLTYVTINDITFIVNITTNVPINFSHFSQTNPPIFYSDQIGYGQVFDQGEYYTYGIVNLPVFTPVFIPALPSTIYDNISITYYCTNSNFSMQNNVRTISINYMDGVFVNLNTSNTGQSTAIIIQAYLGNSPNSISSMVSGQFTFSLPWYNGRDTSYVL